MHIFNLNDRSLFYPVTVHWHIDLDFRVTGEFEILNDKESRLAGIVRRDQGYNIPESRSCCGYEI